MQTRERNEHVALVKRASFIAREVARFWLKARQVVTYKVNETVNAARKEKMDRQLDLLVNQSEKCVDGAGGQDRRSRRRC